MVAIVVTRVPHKVMHASTRAVQYNYIAHTHSAIRVVDLSKHLDLWQS